MGNCYGVPIENHTLTPSQTPNTTPGRNIKQYAKDDAGSSATKNTELPPSDQNKPISRNLKIFSAAELKTATHDFGPDRVLGGGGFGTVYKGWIDQKTFKPSKSGVGTPIAVKRSDPSGDQGFKEWQCEVKFLGRYNHQNLVHLIGYGVDENDFFLVYEYMQQGSLENHLFKKGQGSLSWTLRLKIMIGAARGLAFLHSAAKSVIYRDFKAANILLDGTFNAKLSDFGLAKVGPLADKTHVTTRVMGTYGYAAPEYVATGHLCVKSDVYGFGVVLLEVLTGMRAFDTNRPSASHNLVEWVKPSLSSKKKLKKIMDPRLEGQYPLKGAGLAAELTLKCLQTDKRARPCMDQVLEILERINALY